MISLDAVPRRKTVPWRILDTEALVINVKGGVVYPLNSVGARIWQLADGTRSAGDIVRTLAEEFDANEATIRDDALTFLGELVRAELITTF